MCRISFLFKDEYYSIVTYIFFFLLPIHPSVGTWVASSFWLLQIIMLLWTRVYKYLFKSMISILLVIYQEVALDHMAILGFIFWGITIPFSTVTVSLYICQQRIRLPSFPPPLQHLFFSVSFCFVLVGLVL